MESKNSSRTLLLILFFTLTAVLVATFFMESSFSTKPKELPTISVTQKSHPIIKTACTTTLYPSLCFTTFSSVSNPNTTFHTLLEMTINETMKSVVNARTHLMGFFTFQDLSSQEKSAMQDCLVMLDLTLYELGQAIDDLHSLSSFSITTLHYLYDLLKTLLSAAMTNQDTCINGFLDLDEFHLGNDKKMKLKENVQELLAPITRMISNCLSIITYMENLNDHSQKVVREISKFPSWMTRKDRFLMEKRAKYLRPDVIVANDGNGDYYTIGEAVRMAPNWSTTRFMIKIKAGVYNETVEIYREKVNIMLIGEGMSRTIIVGSRNFADGFSTITSATLIAGDKFLARDLTVLNTAGPYKYQAVAARVISNSVFYRCNFSSYQDTLYAHSFHQFYYECTIKGTIDFIFGNAAAVFQNCLILVGKPIPGQRNMITAQGREDPNQNTGILLLQCTILAAPEFTVADRRRFATFLGRPWRNYSRTIVMKSYMGDLINSQGWSKWNQYSNLDTVEYVEYMNYGPGSDTRYRVNWRGYEKNCSEDIVNQFALGTFLHESEYWFEFT